MLAALLVVVLTMVTKTLRMSGSRCGEGSRDMRVRFMDHYDSTALAVSLIHALASKSSPSRSIGWA